MLAVCITYSMFTPCDVGVYSPTVARICGMRFWMVIHVWRWSTSSIRLISLTFFFLLFLLPSLQQTVHRVHPESPPGSPGETEARLSDWHCPQWSLHSSRWEHSHTYTGTNCTYRFQCVQLHSWLSNVANHTHHLPPQGRELWVAAVKVNSEVQWRVSFFF